MGGHVQTDLFALGSTLFGNLFCGGGPGAKLGDREASEAEVAGYREDKKL